MSRRVTLIIALALKIGSTAETKEWEQWVSKAQASVKAGDQSGAIKAFERAAVLAVPGINIDERNFVGILSAEALAYVDAGQYVQAEYQWRRAASIVRKSEGADSLEYVLLRASLVALPTFRGNLEEEISFLRRAAVRYRQTAAPRDLGVIRSNLAQLLMERNQYAEAEALLQDLRADLERLNGGEPEQLASVLESLGLFLYRQRRFPESLDLYRKEVTLLETAFGHEHFYLGTPLGNSAALLAKLGRMDEACTTFERATSICGKTIGGATLPCAKLFENYATLLGALGQKKQARQMAKRGRQIEREFLQSNGIGFTVDASTFVKK